LVLAWLDWVCSEGDLKRHSRHSPEDNPFGLDLIADSKLPEKKANLDIVFLLRCIGLKR
jgi:hypothetical protein